MKLPIGPTLAAAAVDAPEPENQPGAVTDLIAILDRARERASAWPDIEFRNFDGGWKREPAWRKMLDIEVSEVSLPPALVEMFGAPFPSPLPPRQDLVFTLSGVPLAAEVLDAKSLPGRMWRLKLWVWGPADARVAAPAEGEG